MIVATDTDDVDGSDDDDDDDDNDDDDDDNYDEGFSSGMNVIDICGMNSRLIYDGKIIFILNSIIERYE